MGCRDGLAGQLVQSGDLVLALPDMLRILVDVHGGKIAHRRIMSQWCWFARPAHRPVVTWAYEALRGLSGSS